MSSRLQRGFVRSAVSGLLLSASSVSAQEYLLSQGQYSAPGVTGSPYEQPMPPAPPGPYEGERFVYGDNRPYADANPSQQPSVWPNLPPSLVPPSVLNRDMNAAPSRGAPSSGAGWPAPSYQQAPSSSHWTGPMTEPSAPAPQAAPNNIPQQSRPYIRDHRPAGMPGVFYPGITDFQPNINLSPNPSANTYSPTPLAPSYAAPGGAAAMQRPFADPSAMPVYPTSPGGYPQY